MERMRARSEARRAYRREVRRLGHREPLLGPSLAPFPCFQLCMDCGRLLPPRAELQEARRAERLIRSCPACNGDNIVDLRNDEMVEQLCDADEQTAAARTGALRRAGRRLAALAMLLVLPLGLLALVDPEFRLFAQVTAWVTGPAFLIVTFLFAARLRETWCGTKPAQSPARWSYVRRPRGRLRKIASGPVRASEELIAPVSGRRCVAYEIGLRPDTKVRGRPGTWTLLEQRVATGLQVGGRPVEDQVHLQLERTIASHDGDRLRTFMRERGLPFPLEGFLYESIVVPGDEAIVRTGANALVLESAGTRSRSVSGRP